MLEKGELIQITGGAAKVGLIAAIISGVVFIIGVIDGYLRPKKCNS